MFLRSVLIAKVICQQATKGKCDRSNSLPKAGAFIRQFSCLYKDHKALQKCVILSNKRTLVWSRLLLKDDKVEDKAKNNESTKMSLSDTKDPKEKETQIIKLLDKVEDKAKTNQSTKMPLSDSKDPKEKEMPIIKLLDQVEDKAKSNESTKMPLSDTKDPKEKQTPIIKVLDNVEDKSKSHESTKVQLSDSEHPVNKDAKEKETPVKLLASGDKKSQIPDVKTEKILLNNVKEQSLEKVAPVTSSEPLKKLKEKIVGIKEPKEAKEEPAKTPPLKKRKRVDFTAQSVERNFITPVRAMSDFLLKPSDLEALPKTKRRSPYECEPPITVYWRKDVEAKATEIWGSKENVSKEKIRRDIEKKKYQQNLFTVKRRLRDYRRELGKSEESEVDTKSGLMGRSGKVVITAVAINGANFLFKLFAWVYTGSHSMFSECIHSLADTINQLILAFGIHKSVQIANSEHPYGYTNMKYVASLISGVGIFCVGTGLSFYHGITGLLYPEQMQDFYWAYFILGGSLVSEGATWLVALNSIKKGASEMKISVQEYIFRSQDPSVNVVLLEDFAAVVGVLVAGCCMGLSSLTNSAIPDAFGSLLVGCILGCVASFIIYTNVAALVGRSIPQENLDKINCELESDILIRAIHDVKGIDMGNNLVRYKAELDFDGRELSRAYLDKQDLNAILEEVKKFGNIDQLEMFMLKHGENIVDMMGGEIDRIEMKLRKKFPEIRHCDLEIL